MKTEELKYMISPQDFYMNYAIKHMPVIIKGNYVDHIQCQFHLYRAVVCEKNKELFQSV